MHQSAVLKSSVTRRKAEPVDQAERLLQAAHHQAASAASSSEPKAREPEKPKREQHVLQSAFLASNLNRRVDCYLLNGVKLTGTLRQFDQFTVLIEGPDGIDSLVFKHVIATIAHGSR